MKFANSVIQRSLLGDWLCNRSSGGGKKNCIAYCLVCIFIIISSISSIFLCCFIKLSMSTHEFYLLSILLPIPLGGRSGVSEWLSGPGCWVKPRQREPSILGGACCGCPGTCISRVLCSQVQVVVQQLTDLILKR